MTWLVEPAGTFASALQDNIPRWDPQLWGSSGCWRHEKVAVCMKGTTRWMHEIDVYGLYVRASLPPYLPAGRIRAD